MSFWLEDEVEESPEFECEHCGGTEFYLEGAHQVCRTCFAHSQSQTQSQLEYEEVMQLAAKTRGGQIVQTHRKKAGKRETKPLEDLDQSVPLPDLEWCIRGYQAILSENMRRLHRLIPDLPEEFDGRVKTMWASYLQAWSNGAELYGKLYPHQRFSLRDSFLSGSQRLQIKRQLAYDVAGAKGLVPSTDRPNKRVKVEEVTDVSHSDQSDDEAPEAPVSSIRVRNPSKRNRKNDFRHLVRQHGLSGRMEVALFVKPDMLLLAGILWLALEPLGITPSQVVHWIESGDLQLSHHVWSDALNKRLVHVRPQFTLKIPPTVEIVDAKAQAMRVICYQEESDTAKKVDMQPIAMALAQISADLGFSQLALDWALQLASFPIGLRQQGLPRAEDAWSPARVCALMLCGIQKDPSWREWKPRVNRNGWLPRNTDQFNLLGNGPSLDAYLAYVECTSCREGKCLLPPPDAFKGDLESSAAPTHNASGVLPFDKLGMPKGAPREELLSRVDFNLSMRNRKKLPSKTPRTPILLDKQQKFLVELLADHQRISEASIIDSLLDLLY